MLAAPRPPCYPSTGVARTITPVLQVRLAGTAGALTIRVARHLLRLLVALHCTSNLLTCFTLNVTSPVMLAVFRFTRLAASADHIPWY
jgi:hypothetical protein